MKTEEWSTSELAGLTQSHTSLRETTGVGPLWGPRSAAQRDERSDHVCHASTDGLASDVRSCVSGAISEVDH